MSADDPYALSQPHPSLHGFLRVNRLLNRVLIPGRGAIRGLRAFERIRAWWDNRDPPPVGTVRETTIEGSGDEIPLRIYRPRAAGSHPTIVFFHGGGFVAGSLDTHDRFCRNLTESVPAVVVSVGYRLAPESPFPAAVEDADAAIRWVGDRRDRLGRGSLVVAGDSAGGNLAAVAALLSRDFDGPTIDHQVLVYPAIGVEEDQTSVKRYAGYVLTEASLRALADAYYGSPIHREHPYGDPIKARSLAGLPPATVITAGFDPLRDGGMAYTDRLRQEGVRVRHYNYPDMVHGFATMGGESGVPHADDCLERVADAVGRASD